jgi:hypothetical protein
MRDIAESDWKLLRQLHQVALDRFCQRVLSEVGKLTAAAEPNPHQRYLAVCELIRHRDREMAEAFDDLRRSTALLRLARIQSQHLLTEEEFGYFSRPTRDAVEALLAVRRA